MITGTEGGRLDVCAHLAPLAWSRRGVRLLAKGTKMLGEFAAERGDLLPNAVSHGWPLAAALRGAARRADGAGGSAVVGSDTGRGIS
jgi:hypothetical protein